jgi:hypothetical protein
LAAAVVALFFASPAGAYVYWTELGGFGEPGVIGRANNDGSHANAKFVRKGGIGPVAITADSKHVYWINADANSIARAKLNGRGVDQAFIKGAGGFARDLVVANGYLYWSVGETTTRNASIARARLDGSHVDLDFIPFEDPAHFSTPTELAVVGDYLYWTNSYKAYSIGRARTDGSDVNQAFIAGPPLDVYSPRLHNPFGLAANEDYIYWTNKKSIARADIDGTNTDLQFIPDVGHVGSLALDDKYLYWPDRQHSLMRANLDGSHLKTLAKPFKGDAIFVDRLGP